MSFRINCLVFTHLRTSTSKSLSPYARIGPSDHPSQGMKVARERKGILPLCCSAISSELLQWFAERPLSRCTRERERVRDLFAVLAAAEARPSLAHHDAHVMMCTRTCDHVIPHLPGRFSTTTSNLFCPPSQPCPFAHHPPSLTFSLTLPLILSLFVPITQGASASRNKCLCASPAPTSPP